MLSTMIWPQNKTARVQIYLSLDPRRNLFIDLLTNLLLPILVINKFIGYRLGLQNRNTSAFE